MRRIDCMKSVAPLTDGILCVTTQGGATNEWNAVRPSDGNLQMKTLGLGSSVGLGIALGLPHRKVVVFDGDGAVLMNLSGLVTVGWMQPKNLVHIVFDNKGYEASGATPTATAFHANLTELAKGAGIRSAVEVRTVAEFEQAFKRALSADGPHFINAVVEIAKEVGQHTRYDEVENRYRFIRHLEKLEGREILAYPADISRNM